jgi:hypothetical protein
VLAQHRQILEAQLRKWHLHAATNSMQQLFAAVEETGKKCLQKQLMGYVARCYRVARCCHENMLAWKNGREVQQATMLARQAEWVAEQEALYARGVVPGLPSDTSIDESSELVEVSVQGPLGVTEDVSVGDSEEWEDVW